MTLILFIARSVLRVFLAVFLLAILFFGLTIFQIETKGIVSQWTIHISVGLLLLAIPFIARLKLKFLRAH